MWIPGVAVISLWTVGRTGTGNCGDLRRRRTCRGRPVFITDRHVLQLPSAKLIGDDKASDSTEFEHVSSLLNSRPNRPISPPSTMTSRTGNTTCLVSAEAPCSTPTVYHILI